MVDRIITDLAVFDITGGGDSGGNHPRLLLSRLAPGISLDEVREKTEPEFLLSETLEATLTLEGAYR